MPLMKRNKSRWPLILPSVIAMVGLLMTPSFSGTNEMIILSWNDLGMHCMNQYHHTLSILPPFNTLQAQVILKGDEVMPPMVVTDGLTLEYSIPGNTYSVGKTDFWDYVFDLFGVQLPDDIGLTGKGLTGEMDVHGDIFVAEGVPLTPFPDDTPTQEDPYQQALLIARDGQGVEVANSEPVIPVSVEVGCVSAGCHTSEAQILNGHEREGGFDPNDTPILCAECHADPALGTDGISEAGYFSEAIHEAHTFIDEQIPGLDGCMKCHPGQQAQCLRGTMANDYGMICQDCHGGMHDVSQSIDDGRVPWVEEPACRNCHTATFGEPPGQLYRNSSGHGGVRCSGCHGSPHAIYPSREERDNANIIALQGHAGTLSDCTVCHGHTPAGSGPHGLISSDVVEAELNVADPSLQVYPSIMQSTCSIEFEGENASSGKLLVFDAQGRTVKVLRAQSRGEDRLVANWDGTGRYGEGAPSGIYFISWKGGAMTKSAKVVLMR